VPTSLRRELERAPKNRDRGLFLDDNGDIKWRNYVESDSMVRHEERDDLFLRPPER
jgi:hypothetical protein